MVINQELGLMSLLVRVAALLLLSIGDGVLHAQALQITSPANGTVVAPGQNIGVTVASSGTFQEVVVIGTGPIGMSPILTAPPYQFSVAIPADMVPGQYWLTADGITAPGQGTTSGSISLTVERPDNPVSLSAQPGVMSFRLTEDQCPLMVVGTFPDGSLIDVTASSYISYQSDAPSVAAVDGDGHVTAVAPGSANITAAYAGVTNSLIDRIPIPG